MSLSRRALTGLMAVALVASIGVMGTTHAAGMTGELVVFYAEGTTTQELQSAVEGAGGTVLDVLPQVNIAKVSTDNPRFASAVTRHRRGAGYRAEPLHRNRPSGSRT